MDEKRKEQKHKESYFRVRARAISSGIEVASGI
jgi:hypothetical protein